jgi:DNA mismatch repair protein MutS
MKYESIVGVRKLERKNPEDITMPRYFYDLNLDQIVQDILDQQKLYDLRRFFFVQASPEDICYRLEVLKDFDQDKVHDSVVNFAIGMRKAKEYLKNITDSKVEVQKQKWKLDAASCYLNCILKFQSELDQAELTSRGMQAFRDWLKEFTTRKAFLQLREDTEKLIGQFQVMKYNIHLKRDRVIINQEYLEEDYCKQLQDTFKVQSDQEHYYQANPFSSLDLSALEEAVLNILRKPYEATFHELAEYNKKYHDFLDETLLEFELESQFYIAFRAYRELMKEMKFHFCYPDIRENAKMRILEGYDLALAKKNAIQKKEVVFNDCYYNEGEQFFVITGPNQGGKTTFARAMGQILYFGSIGLMAPCREASFPFFTDIYTHFAVEENIDTGAGKLKEELIRLQDLMSNINHHSFVIINEIFTSATSYDAYLMGKKVLNFFMEANCFGIYVTHIYELTKEDHRIVSMVASLLSEDSNIRTFKIERRNADGRSYANTIVEKYHMTYQEIKERLKR